MSLVVCCPCGNPLDCDNLELIVGLACPECDREILLELDGRENKTARAVLSVVEGPYWIGEQFVMPVGVDLPIGRGVGNWLSLEDDGLSQRHCRLHLTKEGRITVEDQDSDSGTWIADQRILRGRLAPRQSFRIGEFCFRIDLQSAGAVESTAPPAPVEGGAEVLPSMAPVRPLRSPTQWLVLNRFYVSRLMLTVFAWLAGIHHACFLPLHRADGWSAAQGCLAGLVVLAVLLGCGRGVTMDHRYFKFASLGALGLVAVTCLFWGMPLAAVASLMLAASLAMLIVKVPSYPWAMVAGLLGLTAVATMLVLGIQSIVRVASATA